jgi:hypothetical protein
MRSAKVIKAFPYAADGINIEVLPVGRSIDLSASTFDGLAEAGYVQAAGTDTDSPSEEEVLNQRLVQAIDRRLAASSDEELKSIIARSGAPFEGNLVHAALVAAAKEQLVREAEGFDPHASPVSTSAGEDGDGDENKATDRHGNPLPGGAGTDPTDEARRALAAMTNAQLREIADKEKIAVEGDDNKAGLVDKIIAGRQAAAQS